MDTQKNTLPGWQRFDYFLQQLQTAFNKAETTDNPALSLYQQNIRTPLFMLEALTRLYRDMHNKKKFNKLNEVFKIFEDKLGAVDYYDGFAKEFFNSQNISDDIKGFIKSQMGKKLSDLNVLLTGEGWIGSDNKRVRKIYEKLEKADWLGPEEDAAGIKKSYEGSITALIKNIEKSKINFDSVEGDVHELRRELRWLSIYPQALRGLIQMKPSVDSPEYLKKYLTPEIINSPFNKMPEAKVGQPVLYVNADYFYALSWLIAELGKLKDNGLKIVVLKEAVQSLNKISDGDAEQQSLLFCGEGQITTLAILEKAKNASLQFFGERVLEQMLIE